jgi:hypothetical protein
MLLKNFMEHYPSETYKNLFLENDYNLLLKDNLYHQPNFIIDQTDWKTNPACLVVGSPAITKLKAESPLCELCFPTAKNLYHCFINSSVVDYFTAYHQLENFQFSVNKDVILNQMHNIEYLYNLALEFDRAAEDSFEDDAQAYFIIKDLDEDVAQVFSEKMNSMVKKAWEDSLNLPIARKILEDQLGVTIDTNLPKVKVACSVIYLRRELVIEDIDYNDINLLSWLTAAVYDHQALNSVKIVELPLEVALKLSELNSPAMESKIYQNLDQSLMDIVAKLWTPYNEGVFKSFDDAYSAAQAL